MVLAGRLSSIAMGLAGRLFVARQALLASTMTALTNDTRLMVGLSTHVP